LIVILLPVFMDLAHCLIDFDDIRTFRFDFHSFPVIPTIRCESMSLCDRHERRIRANGEWYTT
jgi:hypothetical protein